MRNLIKPLAGALIVLTLIGCGRFGPPLPPERLAPRAVSDLEVTADDHALNFSWGAPHLDERGKELKSIDGYFVYRKIIRQQSDISDPAVPYQLISTVPDTHIITREKLRAEARAQGKPGRRIEAPAAQREFKYSDTDVKQDESYLYKIVPFNEGDVEGIVDQQTLVLFTGTTSKVTPVTPSVAGTDLSSAFDEFE
jgi:predicted small lipoprotein YifL